MSEQSTATFTQADVGRLITINRARPRWWHPVRLVKFWRRRRWERKHPMYISSVGGVSNND